MPRPFQRLLGLSRASLPFLASLPCLASLPLGALLLVAPALLGQGARAQGAPRSVADCERLKNDLAYNQCLSMFGPAAKNVAGGYAAGEAPNTPLPPPEPADAKVASTNAATGLPQVEEPVLQTRGGRRRSYRGRGGRQHAVFTAGSVGPRAHRRRRR